PISYVDVVVAEPGIQTIMGDVGYGEAVDAYFDVSSGTPVVVGGTEGLGPDIKGGVTQLNEILFGAGGERTIAFVVGTVQPEITVADAQAMGVTELIVTYELNYGASGGDTRMFNIERALDFLNASKGRLVAPGANWGWHEVIGNCSYETGFLGAGALVDGVRVIEEGGGICNVASAVYNAAYEAGLPIIERHNHSIYMANYPLGRDATVSWPSPDMIFQNDTQHYILVTAEYDGNDMWISIWGTSEGRTFTSESFWSGTNRVINYRNVYDANGNLLIEDTFVSTFRTPETTTTPTPTPTETTTTPVTPETPATPETPETPETTTQ
ncbi:MAG: VanW family protein, partial [Actinobacteria bacterium]|nr:VanW family protein [Actinomycetota bacterium]